MEISNKDDFGDTHHMASTEPYFYDSAYQLIKQQPALPVDKQGKCVVAEITIVKKQKNKENKKASSSDGKPAANNNSNASNKKSKHKKNTMEIWPCTSECKAVTESEVQSQTIVDKTIDQLRQDLYTCDDGCPNTHIETFSHCDPNENQFVFCALAGHPLVYSNDSNCQSELRILRAVATHYPKLVTFMHQLYIVIRCLKVLEEIDKALWTGDLEYWLVCLE